MVGSLEVFEYELKNDSDLTSFLTQCQADNYTGYRMTLTERWLFSRSFSVDEAASAHLFKVALWDIVKG